VYLVVLNYTGDLPLKSVIRFFIATLTHGYSLLQLSDLRLITVHFVEEEKHNNAQE
jgi:hypothetical protein